VGAARTTETLDRLYLEWAQFTSAETPREQALKRIAELAQRYRQREADGTTETGLATARVELDRALGSLGYVVFPKGEKK